MFALLVLVSIQYIVAACHVFPWIDPKIGSKNEVQAQAIRLRLKNGKGEKKKIPFAQWSSVRACEGAFSRNTLKKLT